MKLFRDTLLLYKYHMQSTLRNPVFVIIGLFQPLCFLFLFAPLLDGFSHTNYFAGVSALSIFIPGLLIMMGMYSTSFAGFVLIDEVRTGFMERLWVSPVNRLALVLGRVLRDLTILLTQACSLLVLATIKGLTANTGGILLSLGLVILVGTTLSSCSYMLALLFKEEEALAATINFFVLPLQLLSGITLPLTLAPQWLQTLAKFNPLSYAVDGSRALFLGDFSSTAVYISFAIMLLFAIFALYGLVKIYRSKAV